MFLIFLTPTGEIFSSWCVSVWMQLEVNIKPGSPGPGLDQQKRAGPADGELSARFTQKSQVVLLVWIPSVILLEDVPPRVHSHTEPS